VETLGIFLPSCLPACNQGAIEAEFEFLVSDRVNQIGPHLIKGWRDASCVRPSCSPVRAEGAAGPAAAGLDHAGRRWISLRAPRIELWHS
jgi:hypothetical protein